MYMYMDPYQEIRINANQPTKLRVMHEIFHTLGRGHEHQRSDRDYYIKVFMENVIKG